MGHTKVYNNDIEFVPARRELAVTKGKSLGRAHQNQFVCLRLEHQLWLSKKLILFSGKMNAVLKQALSK